MGGELIVLNARLFSGIKGTGSGLENNNRKRENN